MAAALRRIGATQLGILALVATQPAGAPAQPAPFLTFAEERLDASCADLVTGKAFTVVNNTADPRDLSLILSPSTAPGSAFAQACGGLEFGPRPQQVPAGDSISVLLRGRSRADPDEAVTGAVVAFSTTGVASRLPLSIVAASDSAPPKPLVDSVAGTQYLGNRKDDTPFYVPVDLGEKATAALTAGEVVGAVSGDGDRAAVTYVETKIEGSTALVGLDADGLSAGKYQGQVDLLPGEDEGDVTLALTVKDFWFWPFILLTVSFIVALLAQRASGVWLPRSKLKAKAGGVAQTYVSARGRLSSAQGTGEWKKSTLTDVETRIAALKSDVDTKTSGAYVSIDAKVIEALEAAIAASDASVSSFGELAAELPKLEAALMKLADEPSPTPDLVGITPGQKEPALAAAARAHLGRRDYAIAQLPVVFGDVGASRTAVEQIWELESEISTAYRHAVELARWWADHGDADKQARAHGVIVELHGIRHQLWETDDVDRPPELAKQLRSVENSISLLWPASLTRATAFGAMPTCDAVVEFSGEARTLGLRAEHVDLYSLIGQARDDAERAKWLERAALALGLVLAFVAGMAFLYIGKPFGTPWDYVTAVTWGFVTPTALVAVGAALNSIGALTALQRRLG